MSFLLLFHAEHLPDCLSLQDFVFHDLDNQLRCSAETEFVNASQSDIRFLLYKMFSIVSRETFLLFRKKSALYFRV